MEWEKILRAGALVAVAITMVFVDFRWDRTEGRIPNVVSLPILALGMIGALIFSDPTGLILWPAFYLGWKAGGVGGGDAKVWMGVSALSGISGSVVGLAVLVLLARIRLWRHGYGWIFGLRPPARVPMALPTAGMAMGAAIARFLAG
ncbi:hypothetical protein [Thermoflexus sp.]|uniref:hypothetical protein n=1 Tax=Thermoflexus sp. TaxID=1969742 RepID=UPI002ADDE5E8|nr:hypothetical protein [Thermoflexus sp.]